MTKKYFKKNVKNIWNKITEKAIKKVILGALDNNKEFDIVNLKKNTQLNGTISFMFIQQSSAVSDYIWKSLEIEIVSKIDAVMGFSRKNPLYPLLRISIFLKLTPWISIQIHRYPIEIFHFWTTIPLEIYTFSLFLVYQSMNHKKL